MTIAEKINEYASTIFTEIQNAEEEYHEAEAERNKFKLPSGDAEYMAKAARAMANFELAKAELNNIKLTIPGKVNDTLSQLRSEYKAEIEKELGANAADINMQQLELLKSGIMKPDEYTAMFNKAASEKNATMLRMIGKYASEAAEQYEKVYGVYDARCIELRTVANMAKQDLVSAALSVFDSISEIMRRSVNNPGIIPSWDAFTDPLFKLL